MELKKLMEYCINKWNRKTESDERIKKVEKYFEEWFSNIPEEYKSMVEILIKNLEYYPRKVVNNYLVELHNKLLEKGNINDDNTIYVFIKSRSGKGNSSNDYWTEYKNINELNREICYENMHLITNEQWKYIDNIIFIDDFCGTGNTFINEIKSIKKIKKIRKINKIKKMNKINKREKLNKTYLEKRIFYIIIVTMEVGLKEIETYAESKKLLITLVYKFIEKKAFEQKLFITDDEIAKESLINLSEELKIPKKQHLGYGESQSLVAFYNNTPNNTIGLMRYDTDVYKSLFPRKNDKKPSWKTMKKNEKERKMRNYNSKIKKGKNYE